MKKDSIILGILSAFLGMNIMIQFKTTDTFMKGMTSSKKALELKSELDSLTQRKQMLLNELNKLDGTINEYKISESENIKNLQQEIKVYEILSGKTDVKGPGIIISINKSEEYKDEEVSYYHLDFLLRVINILNESGAEAISLNDQRILNTTSILLKNGNLTIDNKPSVIPFEIKCIGNPEKLERALNIRYGILFELKKDKVLEAAVEKKENINLQKATQTIKFKYSTLYK